MPFPSLFESECNSVTGVWTCLFWGYSSASPQGLLIPPKFFHWIIYFYIFSELMYCKKTLFLKCVTNTKKY